MRRGTCVALVLLVILQCSTWTQGVPAIPNQSRLRGTVVGYSILDSDLVDVSPRQTLYRLAVVVDSTEGVPPYPDLLAGAVGTVIEVLSSIELHPCLYGRLVEFEARRVGDESGRKTWLVPGTLVVLGTESPPQTPSFCLE